MQVLQGKYGFELNYMDVKEFKDKGYLQELNRLFLHPLGLALSVVDQGDGSYRIGGIWDYRNDPEGIIYDLKNSDPERIKRFSDNALFISNELANHIEGRTGKDFNWGVELIPTEKLH